MTQVRELLWRLTLVCKRNESKNGLRSLTTGFSQHYLVGLKGLWNLADALILGLLIPALTLRIYTCVRWSGRVSHPPHMQPWRVATPPTRPRKARGR